MDAKSKVIVFYTLHVFIVIRTHCRKAHKHKCFFTMCKPHVVICAAAAAAARRLFAFVGAYYYSFFFFRFILSSLVILDFVVRMRFTKHFEIIIMCVKLWKHLKMLLLRV